MAKSTSPVRKAWRSLAGLGAIIALLVVLNAIGALFFILFRELFSIWTSNWLLWFGLVFVAFVLYSPGGLVGIWAMTGKRTPSSTGTEQETDREAGLTTLEIAVIAVAG